MISFILCLALLIIGYFTYGFLTLQDWDLFLVRCRVHFGDQSYFSGSRLVQFLPAVFMTTSLE